MSADETSAPGADSPDADIDRDGERILSVEGVGKRFSGLQALDDVDMTVNRGEIIGLIGPNGAGKTTLFNCISGAFPPTSGTVRLDGEVISGLPAHKIARAGLARTFQITRPLEELTVVENAMVGAHIHTRRRSEAREIAMETLEFVGLADKAEAEAGELTVGAQKRLELARAVSTRPEILLLDEIMAGLTPSESNQMLDLFRQLRERGTSLLIIEHDMKAIMNISDYVKVLDQGKGIAFGAPETVVEDDRVIEAYIGGFDVDA
ncbi:ABC transporter ATP-binding protein [Haloferax chudinovii]|uniref:Probable branched-chain amino acid transport ATP-binding protein LivG n=1 Tax=Haloferax chudinovii TaxID=1109010 RepID=A0ABD5X9I9_9EURY